MAGDYGDHYFLAGALQGVEEVVNLAYTTIPKTSFDDPVRDILDNLPASVNLFETATLLGIKKIVFISSGGTVYGQSDQRSITEDCPTNPVSPYGITKLAIEKYAGMYHELKSLPVICVRPGNAYGEGQRPYAGQGFVATAIASIIEQREIILFGESGTIRDYVHVTDVARGIIAAMEQGRAGECYNIGTGTGRTNLEVLDALRPFAEEAGLAMTLRHAPLRRFDVPANILDSGKLRNETGWQCTVPFENGLRDAWNWYRSNTARLPVGQQQL
jgi:UDP-glucose 4-epimerase